MTKARAPLFARTARKSIVSRSAMILADGRSLRSKGAVLFYLLTGDSRPSRCSATTTVSRHRVTPSKQRLKQALLPINRRVRRKRVLRQQVRISKTHRGGDGGSSEPPQIVHAVACACLFAEHSLF